MAGLSAAEKASRLNPELQSLLDSRRVDVAVQASLFDAGIADLSLLSAIAVTREELKTFAGAHLGLDPGARPDDMVRFATLFLAWQSASNRVMVLDMMNSELSAQKLPKSIPPLELTSLRGLFERQYYKMKDVEIPARASFEDLCEQLEAGELRPMSLRHFGSKADDEDNESGTLQLGKSGQVKIRRSKIETPAPTDMEALRSKVVLMANHFIFAKLRYNHRASLAAITPFTFLDYLGYLTGKYVARMETQTTDGITLHRPSIKLIINYDYQMRKEVVEKINEGMAMDVALQAVVKDSDLRERHFSTPLAVSSASQSLEKMRGQQEDKLWRRHGPYPPPNIKGKGKSKQKGKGKYKGEFLHSTTPDGRQLCFAWNNKAEGCKGDCNRVHACRICLSSAHPTFLHKNDPQDKKNEGGGTGDS